MNTFFRCLSSCARLRVILATATIVAADLPWVRAQQLSGQATASESESTRQNGSVRVASPADVRNTVHTFAGRRVRSPKGDDFGTIKDCLIDAHSGRVVYAVISSNEKPAKLRLVPFAALQNSEGANGLTVEIERAQWEQLSPLSAEDFEQGRITLGPSERRMLSDRFEQNESRPSETSTPALTDVSRPDPSARTSGTHLVRASRLRGKRVSTPADSLGIIVAIVIDADRMTSAALLEPEREIASGETRFIVPLRQLNLAATDLETIQTTLTRADFQEALRIGQERASPTLNGEPQLSPTGRNDDAKGSAGMPSASRLAEIVEEALASASQPASGRVMVDIENGKAVLRGSVSSQQIKDNVERALRQVVDPSRIVNRIAVAK